MKKLILNTALLSVISMAGMAQWVAQPSNLSANRYAQFIDAVDTSVVWAIAADPANQSTPVQEFTKTIDGGNLWIAGPINNAVGLSPSGIYGLNADTAWAAMFNGTAGGGKIMKTTDGGVNWTWQTTAAFAAPAGFPNIVYFFDANNGICMGDPNAGYFEIYTTTDGGDNWIRTPQANIATQLTGEFGVTSVYTAHGDSTLWFGTNLGRIYKTTDRGLNWAAFSTPYTGSYIGDIAFKDALNGIATNGSPASALSDIIRTTDGGATWSLVATNTANILTKVLSYVPGTAATYFLSSPQAGGGTAFTLDDGDTWVSADNLIHSDIEFTAAEIGWTGSNELNAPMFRWNGPVAANCAVITGPLTFASADSICAFDSVIYSVPVDFTNDPSTRIGFNAVFYDEFFNQIGAQSVPDLIAAGFPNQFIPDPGTPDIGTLNFTIFFSLAPTSEIVHFSIQVFPTQCTDDTSNAIINSVFQDVSSCAIVNVGTNQAVLDMTTCPMTGLVTYTVSHSVNGGTPIAGDTFSCVGSTGFINLEFLVDNGICVKTISAQINCTGVGIDELEANDFMFYPNPAGDQITIKTGSELEISSLVITDLAGRIVAQIANPVFSNTTFTMPLDKLQSGSYLITIFSDNKIAATKKLIRL